MNTYCSCVCGAEDEEIISVVGGDAGILIRGLLAYSGIIEADASQQFVRSVLKSYQEKLNRPIYIHTDSDALEKFDINRASSPKFGSVPENIGCRYLHFCVSEPSKLGNIYIEYLPFVASKVISVIYEIFKDDPPKIKISVAKKPYKEDRVCVVKSKVKKLNPEGHIFVYHPSIEEDLSMVVAEIISETVRFDGLKENLFHKICEISNKHWNNLIDILAPGISHEQVIN